MKLLLLLLRVAPLIYGCHAWISYQQTATKTSLPSSNLRHCISSSITVDEDETDPASNTKQKPQIKKRKHSLHSIHAESWNQKYDQLVTFKEEHGHLMVPQKATMRFPDKDKLEPLATFCRNLRQQYKFSLQKETKHLCFLSEDRVQRLESIGFIWNAHEANWYQRYDDLVDFTQQYGHANVPRQWDENEHLTGWTSYQRQRYKTQQNGDPLGKPLTERQIELMEQIGFKWDPKEELWWSFYEDLKEFGKQNCHFRVPTQYPKNPRLSRWLANVRKLCRDYVLSASIDGTTEGVHVSGLNDERIEALRAIHFCWLPQPGPFKETPPEDIFQAVVNSIKSP